MLLCSLDNKHHLQWNFKYVTKAFYNLFIGYIYMYLQEQE